jgi:hypothetical protein
MLTVGFHPTPDPKDTVYYDVVAEGEKAEELSRLHIDSTKQAVRIGGDNRIHEKTMKQDYEK